jgi:hypothetical protein
MSQPVSSAAGGRVVGGRVPDFFLVGHAKCGTTALYEMLRAHPDIYMPAAKEPQFFARNPDVPAPGAPITFTQTGRFGETLEQYLALFEQARPDQRVGEASTFYLWSALAPVRIAERQPRARIVAILREPASFLRSLHMQMLQNGTETERDLRRALALEAERREGRQIPARAYWPEALIYSQRVRYVEQLRRYEAVFPREQILVLIYDDFRADNAAVLARVLRFLEVDDDVQDLTPIHANPTVEVRNLRLARFVRDVRAGRGPVAGAVRRGVKAVTTPELRRSALYPLRRRLLFRAPPEPDRELMDELRRRFRPEVEAISAHLERDLVKLWGYDGER